ncbi:MAG: hypothetical protein PHC89_00370 [Candidatus Pacebacteria bacterium]|nr:hypothetical protein [Candidatus Paceibacterota bacterium]
MLNSEKKFKKFEELSEEERRFAHDIAKIILCEAQNGILPHPSYIAKNIRPISLDADIEAIKVPKIFLKAQMIAMELAFSHFGKSEIGFNRKTP